MANSKEEKRREIALKKYYRAREVLVQICSEKNISYEEYMTRYPAEIEDSVIEFELNGYVKLMNKDIRLLLKELYLEEWKDVICQSFDKSHQKDAIELIQATIKCDPSNIYRYFSRTSDLLKLLNNDKTKEKALIFFDNYFATHSFDDLVNNYDLVFRSIHAKEVSVARDKGWLNSRTPGFGERKKEKAGNYFNASNKKDDEEKKYEVVCEEEFIPERVSE